MFSRSNRPEGDALRHGKDNGLSIHCKVYGCNKKSVAPNLSNDAGRNALRRLLMTADVMIENYRAGILEKMGLAPDHLLAVNPGLVTVHV